MKVVETIEDLAAERLKVVAGREEGHASPSIGFVPTMGAMHAGHAALIQQARQENDYVIVSIFVNPAQFGPNEDFHRYPRPFEKDVALCEANSVDLIFHPSPEEMYPPGSSTFAEVTKLQDALCGASRPGHFRGVATIVLKLFQVVKPSRAYFGQKDAQQVRIIQQMVADLHVDVEVVVVPTVREGDGLALSSRNRYLTDEQRRLAPILWQALNEARSKIDAGERDAVVIQRLLSERIRATPGAVLDYAAVVDANSLESVARLRGRTLLALAVKFGSTRLIDNLLVTVTQA
jgi:pantoate--beta-alanine ligase